MWIQVEAKCKVGWEEVNVHRPAKSKRGITDRSWPVRVRTSDSGLWKNHAWMILQSSIGLKVPRRWWSFVNNREINPGSLLPLNEQMYHVTFALFYVFFGPMRLLSVDRTMILKCWNRKYYWRITVFIRLWYNSWFLCEVILWLKVIFLFFMINF
jgi:hypothetical protein